jgi:hypothetical protein
MYAYSCFYFRLLQTASKHQIFVTCFSINVLFQWQRTQHGLLLVILKTTQHCSYTRAFDTQMRARLSAWLIQTFKVMSWQ